MLNRPSIAVMTQSGHEENCIQQQFEVFSKAVPPIDYFVLNWNSKIKIPHQTWVVKDPNMKWSEGRQVIYELVTKEFNNNYDYYIFLDDDMIVTSEQVNILYEDLMSLNPLCLAYLRTFTPKQQAITWSHQYLGKNLTQPISYIVKDEDHMILHKSVMQHLFPMVCHGVGCMMWIIERIIHDAFNGSKNILNPTVYLENRMHRPRGVGHGPMKRPNDFNAQQRAVQKTYRKSNLVLYRKKEEKEYVHQMNLQYQDKPQNVNTTRLSSDEIDLKLKQLIDMNHPVWKERKPVYPKYKNSIVFDDLV